MVELSRFTESLDRGLEIRMQQILQPRGIGKRSAIFPAAANLAFKKKINGSDPAVDAFLDDRREDEFVRIAVPGGFVLDQQSEVRPILARLCQLEQVLPFEARMLERASGFLLMDRVDLARPVIGEGMPHGEQVFFRAVAGVVCVEITETAILDFSLALDDSGRIDLEGCCFGTLRHGNRQHGGNGCGAEHGNRVGSGCGRHAADKFHQSADCKKCDDV